MIVAFAIFGVLLLCFGWLGWDVFHGPTPPSLYDWEVHGL